MDAGVGAAFKVIADPRRNESRLESVHFLQLLEGCVAVLNVVGHLQAQLCEYLLVGVPNAVVCCDCFA